MSRAVDETRRRAADACRVDRRARHELSLSLQRDPELERRAAGEIEQCLCLSARRRARCLRASSRSAALVRIAQRECARAGDARDAGADRRQLGHQRWARWRRLAAGQAMRPRGQGLRSEVRRVPRRERRGQTERPARGRAGHAMRRDCGPHRRQLLAVRDDAVRLHSPRDAVCRSRTLSRPTSSTRSRRISCT